MALLVLLACADPTVDTGPAEADGAWTIGEVQACDAPVPAGWTALDRAVETYTSDLADGLAIEPGAVGLVEAEEPWIVWTVPGGPTRAAPLDGGDARDVNPRPATALAQGDLDGDGRVDLVIAGGLLEIVWAFGTADEARAEHFVGERLLGDVAVVDVDGDTLDDLVLGFTDPDHADREGLRPAWLRNLGGRAFAEATPVAGEAATWGPVFDLSVVDVDQDGAPDVYVCNDFGGTVAPNVLLRNEGAALAPADGRGLGYATSCMGVSWGDVAGEDTLAAYLATAAQHVLLAEDAAGWFDIAAARGLGRFTPPQMAWGSALADLDNDGRIDLLVGMSDFYGPGMGPFALGLYRQDDAGQLAEAGGAYGLPTEAHTRGVLARDLDGDGVPELLVGDALRSPWVFASDGCTAEAWLTVDAPSGSRVTVTAGGRTFVALATSEPGWGATAPARAHLGLGDIDTIDAIEVAAPWRAPEVLTGPLAARREVALR